ncbi:uroporphyrinogen-III C-methyltransferase [Citrobacter sp. BDA59-3]|uniref:uroporphyrinogen-III C-methyltransferase n=1 Tax=Citrobacter sp. BDA59-3 TaxID=2781952 RepID=UPI00188031E9|nr:uroporphyrinogen-III C-methyltransferase [Citrobacter sp. BDA59-3]QOV67285.1 uroporphyrinogen-III C-methyltransferase [Citrobacter sp. BDA59-3]
MTGKVWLVGAGPGDPGLLTVKGLNCLREAGAVVFDRLVNPLLLQEAPAGCELHDVGKEANRHPIPQPQINQILIDCASRGLRVVRLKGGDPFVFGRGSEEMQALRECGIECEVVPGITSAIGGLAAAGIPVTHRDFASSFHVVTGHLQDGKEPQDWGKLAVLPGTLVILMGMSQIQTICAALMSAGKPADTPAAVVMRASTPEQKVLCAPLSALAQESEAAGFHAPALIVIGGVVSLREILAFSGSA